VLRQLSLDLIKGEIVGGEMIDGQREKEPVIDLRDAGGDGRVFGQVERLGGLAQQCIQGERLPLIRRAPMHVDALNRGNPGSELLVPYSVRATEP